jgi:signal transduction histidine kinase
MVQILISAFRFLFPLALSHAILLACAFAVEPLTNASQIRSLSREETAGSLPVKLTGVVIYSGWKEIILHDGTASIYLDFSYAQKRGVWMGSLPDLSPFIPGTGLEVEGITDPGGFSPMVLVSKLERTGNLPIPAPIRPTTEELLSSMLDTKWVEVEGVVRKLEDAYMTLQVGGHPCPVFLRNRPNLSSEQLVDARVRVRGVLTNIANLRSQAAGMKLYSNGMADIDILVLPPKDPFQAPRVTLSRLIAYQHDAKHGHRRVSSGLVTFVVPGRFFYLMDQESCVRVDSAEARVAPGDMVEISGFIETTRILASFSEVAVRKIGTGIVPPPATPAISEIIHPKTRSAWEIVTEPGHPDFDGRLIRLGGVLRRVLPMDESGNSTAFIESGENLVQVFFPGDAPSWIEGSVVELTGVCELELKRLDQSPWFSITGFHIWLSSPSDLRLISSPPWWNAQRLGILLLAVVVVLMLALIWGYLMRRQVSIKGAHLAKEISARESAKLEFDTTLRERQRLANDLHDTLEQNLTGLALQLEIASESRASDPAMSDHHLHLAQQFLERSRAEAHRTVWDLRDHSHEGRDFLEILEERVASMVAGTGVTIALQHEGDQVPMPDLIAGNLLLLAQEAVTNALKHSGASKIDILLRHAPRQWELAITDNGRGFDTMVAPGQIEGHFGLQGMRERTKRLGGEIEMASSPEHGTTIRVRVPSPESLHQGENLPK